MACASNASLEGLPFGWESVGDSGLGTDGEAWDERSEGGLELPVDNAGRFREIVFGVWSRSPASIARAVSIARRTCDEVDDCEGLVVATERARAFIVDAEEVVEAELNDFADSDDGRRTGYVTTEAVSVG